MATKSNKTMSTPNKNAMHPAVGRKKRDRSIYVFNKEDQLIDECDGYDDAADKHDASPGGVRYSCNNNTLLRDKYFRYTQFSTKFF